MIKYLSYNVNGLEKRYPLTELFVSVGRGKKNDLIIDEPYISRSHLNIRVGRSSIVIEDSGSENQTFVNGKEVKKAEIKIDQKFVLGRMSFTLKEGNDDELLKSHQFTPSNISGNIYSNIGNMNKTDNIRSLFKIILEELLIVGVKSKNFSKFLNLLSRKLQSLPEMGSIFLLSHGKDNHNIIFSGGNLSDVTNIIERFREEKGLFDIEVDYKSLSGSKFFFRSIPVKLKRYKGVLVYVDDKPLGKLNPDILDFACSLAKEIELVYKLFSQSPQTNILSPDPECTETKIITGNSTMKNLIKHTLKIASSDIFLLIQGESGTGKELFANMIHYNSKRNKESLIAINCATIPENLLESELFGHEKGAFTNAIELKKGKLELASGGTLILDEIGDMPFNLQAKLLRSLQEFEFYRIGGSVPIKVDLRIISMTNKNLKDMILKNQFREDLYFRLVHRTLIIPPLRARREDISLLINHFTNLFSYEMGKNIGGYTVKAYETLVNYNWPGNVRQLKNEINSIVNLADEGEVVDSNLISQEITSQSFSIFDTEEKGEKVFYRKPDKNSILAVLEKNDWNKTKSAKELNMTYRGLHKKMQKLNINRSK